MSRMFRTAGLSGVAMLCLAGCHLFRRDQGPSQVITVPEQTVPHRLLQEEPAPFDGWLLSDALMNEISPAVRNFYESGAVPGEQALDYDRALEQPETYELPPLDAPEPPADDFEPAEPDDGFPEPYSPEPLGVIDRRPRVIDEGGQPFR